MNTKKATYMDILMRLMAAIQNNRILQGISKGFVMAMPIIFMGSFALVIKIIPVTAWKEFVSASALGPALSVVSKFTTNFVAVIYGFCIAHETAKEFKTSPGTCGLLSLIALFIVTPFDSETGNLTMTWLGAQGLFVAMIIAVVTVILYQYISARGWTIKMPESVPPFVSNSFKNIIPSLIILSLFTLVNALFSITPFEHVHQFVFTLIQTPLQNLGGGIVAMVLVATLCQLVWAFGIHASSVQSVMTPIWTAMDMSQLAAATAGTALPYIIGKQFWSVYSDATILPLAILLMAAVRSSRYRSTGKVSIIPAIFNISEPLVFGLPIVLNPLFAIPFILYKPLCLIIAYAATALGLVPRIMAVSVPFGTPYILSGIMQGGPRVALLQILLIFMGLVLYYPFLKAADNMALKEEQAE
ncbi:MAG: PTS sugar transporter subunit IIC [Hungatella sp.]|nr:PTS sugar transporter subunit IIC [Hungatella sp.]